MVNGAPDRLFYEVPLVALDLFERFHRRPRYESPLLFVQSVTEMASKTTMYKHDVPKTNNTLLNKIDNS